MLLDEQSSGQFTGATGRATRTHYLPATGRAFRQDSSPVVADEAVDLNP
jgi:hypothetical protein